MLLNIFGCVDCGSEFFESEMGEPGICPCCGSDQIYDADECVEDLDDSMDGDHASALASAGWGTDEDYGGTDERY